MVVRLFFCVLALLGASPALAGERIVYRPAADAMSLLLDDQRTTFGAIVALPSAPDALALLLVDRGISVGGLVAVRPAPRITVVRGFDMGSSGPLRRVVDAPRVDLSGFEALDAAPLADLSATVAWGPRVPSPFALSSLPHWQRGLSGESVPEGSRFTVEEAVRGARILRRPRALDATLVFRIDGKEESPPLSVGGGITAAIWQVIPKD